MEVFIIIALILAGVLLFIVEVFLIPGISIAGIASAICLLYANYYAFDTLGPVSYTHLDVYKRQGFESCRQPCNYRIGRTYQRINYP